MKNPTPKKVPQPDALEKSRASILSSGVPGVGEIKNTSSLGLNNNRAPNGDYLFRISMVITLDGYPRQNSTKIHQIPKNKTYLIHSGRSYPVKGDPKDPKKVEIDWDNFKKINGKKVLNQVIAQIGPILKNAGYRKSSSRTFNCFKEDGLIHVIDFQPDTRGGNFTVNAAVYVRELRKGYSYKVDEKRIEEPDCTMKLRWRIGDLTPKKFNDWWSYEYPDKAVKEIKSSLATDVLPHLQKYASRSLLHKRWKRSKRKPAR